MPVVCTGNDFSTLYAPLIRDGRMEKYYWNPTREDRVGVCMVGGRSVCTAGARALWAWAVWDRCACACLMLRPVAHAAHAPLALPTPRLATSPAPPTRPPA